MVAIQSAGTSNDPDSDTRFANKQLSLATLLYLATMGGASLCCMEDKIGSFVPGKSFDALLVDLNADSGNPAVWSHEKDYDSGTHATSSFNQVGREERLRGLLERFLFGGDDRNILKVFVQGRCIKG